MYELIIIGGGPAGLTAAVYAARKRLTTVLLSKELGGQPTWTSGVENYMGYQFIDGTELMQKFETQVQSYSIEIKTGYDAVSLKAIHDGFEVRTENDETCQGKAVVIATGKRPRTLNVPGEERWHGKGISYCAVCDGPFFEGMKVAVVGGGNSALEAADDMVKIAAHVYLVSLTPLTGDQILIDKVSHAPNVTVLTEHETLEILGDQFVTAIQVKDRSSGQQRTLEVGGVFVEIGLIPNSNLAKDLVTLNELGEIVVDCYCQTNVRGLYAAGDVTNVPEKQIVIAAGEGAKAALQAHRYLRTIPATGRDWK